MAIHKRADVVNAQSSPTVSFQDRLAVAGNASFICFIVSVVWTVLFFGKAHFNFETLILLAAPLVATGTTVIIGAIFKDLVPKPVVTLPLNITIPLIWCLCCYLAVMLISTQETGSTRVPDPLIPALAWAKLSTLASLLIAQVIALSLMVFFSKETA